MYNTRGRYFDEFDRVFCNFSDLKCVFQIFKTHDFGFINVFEKFVCVTRCFKRFSSAVIHDFNIPIETLSNAKTTLL